MGGVFAAACCSAPRSIHSSGNNPKSKHEDIQHTARSITVDSIRANLIKQSIDDVNSTFVITKETLGRGIGGAVVTVSHKSSGRQYALKGVAAAAGGTDKRAIRRFYNEIQMLAMLDHPNIIRLAETFEHSGALFMIMERCSGGNLGQVMKKTPGNKFCEGRARRIISDLLRAVDHCHEARITHRDIKLGNVLLETSDPDAPIKLIDFGHSCEFTPGVSLTKFVGTRYACAPEVYQKEYSELADLWSVGVLAFECLSGRRPFHGTAVPGVQGSHDASLQASVVAGKFFFREDDWTDISNEAKDFVNSLLSREFLRLSASESWQHPWVLRDVLGQFQDAEVSGITPGVMNQIRRKSRTASDFEQTALMALAVTIPADEIAHLRKAFLALDINHTGLISLACFVEALSSVRSGPTTNLDEILQTFRNADTDDSGSISWTEFLASALGRTDFRDGHLADAFSRIDTDSNGYITVDELRATLGNMDINTKERVQQVIKEVDRDNDGKISLSEFVAVVEQRPDDASCQSIAAVNNTKKTLTKVLSEPSMVWNSEPSMAMVPNEHEDDSYTV